MDITPQMIQCSLIRCGYEYKIIKRYNVYIKAQLNITVSRKAYNSNDKDDSNNQKQNIKMDVFDEFNGLDPFDELMF